MKTPIIILIILWSIGLLLQARLHGRERSGKHSFWTTLIATIINVSLLYWAGLFD